MTSKSKQKIARQNGAKAAGSKSPKGLANSSRNALRHGLTSKSLVLTNESKPAYDRLRLEYFNRFQPKDGVEMDLVEEMVAAKWRQRRMWAVETAAYDLRMELQEAKVAENFINIHAAGRQCIAIDSLINESKTVTT